MWSDFNAANRSAMLKSEVISWPVTLGIMLLAFGSLVAAGLPLMLTMLGLLAAAGSLYLGTLIMPISIWAMNFALMFALALGIDYALFIVMRFRGALLRLRARRRGGDGRHDGHGRQGRAVQRPDRADLPHRGDARPQPRLPQHEPRDHARRHLRARRHAHAAARGAGQARPQGRQAVAALGALRRAPLAALRRLGRAPVAAPARATGCSRSCCSSARLPGDAAEDLDALDQGRAHQRLLARRLQPGAGRDGAGRDRPAAARRAAGQAAGGRADRQARSRHRPGAARPARRAAGSRWSRRSRARTPPTPPSAPRSSGCERTSPPGRCSAARSPKTTTCSTCSPPRRRS